jgi:hypothetical protein
VIHVRNLHPKQTVYLPCAPGWARVLRPGVTTMLPAGAMHAPAVQALLQRQMVCVVTEVTADPGAILRRDLAAAIAAAELAEFAALLARQRRAGRTEQPQRAYRRQDKALRKRRADEWPPEWTDRLRQRWAEHASCTAIAAELGTTVGAVSTKARRLALGANLAPRADAWPLERIERLRQLWARGVDRAVIAADLGVTPLAVQGKAQRLGLLEPRQRPRRAGRVVMPPSAARAA